MQASDDRRRLSIHVDYLFGKGVSKALPRSGIKLYFSRKSGRLKLVFISGNLFATVKPNGGMALTLFGAEILSKSRKFSECCVVAKEEAQEFVRGGKSVFCKFVEKAGMNIPPGGEVAVVDGKGRVLGVGKALMNGKFMTQFKSGVAVKVRDGAGS